MGEKLNAISLFSGIGGFELGLSEYCRTVLYCEADKHAQAVLLSRMAEGAIDYAPICTDVRELTAEFIDIPVDIVYGGFPCQDISSAGKGAGLEGERSGLFFEIVRLAKEIKPPFLFLENVSAIRTRGLDRVIEELTEIGYDLRWTMLSAAEVGAKHKRERWFLLAYAEGHDDRGGLSVVPNESAEESGSEDEHEDQAEQPRPSGGDTRVLADGIVRERLFVVADAECQGIPADTRGLAGEVPEAFGEGGISGDAVTASTCCDAGAGKNAEGSRTIEDKAEGLSRADPTCEGLEGTSGQGQAQQPSLGSQRSGEPGGGPCSTGGRSSQPDVGRVAHGLPHRLVNGKPYYLDPSYWESEPEGIPRVTDEREQRIERIKRLGNAVVPLQVKTAFEYLMGIGLEPLPYALPMAVGAPIQMVQYEFESLWD